MLTDKYFLSVCFPWMLMDGTYLLAKGDGTLFPLPDRAKEQSSIDHCVVAPVGWSKCPIGYAVFVKPLPGTADQRLILHGLKVTGVSTAQGKEKGLSIRTDPKDIENYANTIVDGLDQVGRQFGEIINSNVHEIRSINTDIKNAAEEILFETTGKEIDVRNCEIRSHNVKSLAEILSARTDLLEFVFNPVQKGMAKRSTKVFNKFNKAKLSLESRANEKDIYIFTNGKSNGEIRMLPVFEVIPYLMLQNAIKYSPKHETISMAASENENFISFTVSNTGPKMDANELDTIFLAGRRGGRAIEAGVNGTGIGLYFLKELVETHHDGKLEVWQDSTEQTFDSVLYCKTYVRVTFPRPRY